MNLQKETAKKYQGLFNLMIEQYDLILTESEMDSIIRKSEKVIELEKKYEHLKNNNL